MLAFSSEAEFKVVFFVCDQFIAAEPDHKINSLLLCVGWMEYRSYNCADAAVYSPLCH